MAESVEVVTSELMLAADRLRGAGQQLQDGLSAVDLETGNLLASGWQGEAATAFEKYWDQWHSGAGQVVRALQTMSDALDVAAKNYAETDEQAGGALNATMPGAGGSGGGGAPSPAGSGSGIGTGTGDAQKPDLAQQMNLGGATQPLSQAAGIPGQVAGGLMQAGTAAAGAAQQAMQIATDLAQQAEGAAGGEESASGAPVEPAPESSTPRELR